ncbi:MAG: Saccharopine dehydrogenase [Pyrinomonadaceae bacterium]|nr:Saccharopine dehydrogenase [Pyrinomonadaceae bacterium]
MEKILIVGGYGKVGRIIARELSKSQEDPVVVAGRDYGKAKTLSNELNNAVTPLLLNIDDFAEYKNRIKDVKLVIMCIDQENTEFVEWCFDRGIHYVDITASSEFLSKVELLNQKAKLSESTAILSVGLSPGVTNLLAKLCKIRVPELRYLDIFVLLSAGEKHGSAAIRWMLENINSQFLVMENGRPKQVGSFREKKRTIFSDERNERTAYRFSFSDQWVIAKTLTIDSVSTWISLNYSFLMWAIYWMRKSGVSKLLNLGIIKWICLHLLTLFRFGSERFAVKVSAGVSEEEGYIYECALVGNGEAVITGLVTAEVARRIMHSSFSPGVFHIEELFDPLEFIESIGGYEVQEKQLDQH